MYVHYMTYVFIDCREIQALVQPYLINKLLSISSLIPSFCESLLQSSRRSFAHVLLLPCNAKIEVHRDELGACNRNMVTVKIGIKGPIVAFFAIDNSPCLSDVGRALPASA